MLISFSVRNFLSFKELNTISMIAAKPFKEYLDSHTVEVEPKLRLLKSAVIYGNNASGKSNLVRALLFMRIAILNSFNDSLDNDDEKEKAFPLNKFLLNSKNETEPSFFEITFIQEGKKYRYGFEIEKDHIVSEWLYHTTKKEVHLFKRDLQKIDVNKSAFKEGLGKEGNVKTNVLYLSLLAQLNGEISNTIIRWVNKLSITDGISGNSQQRRKIYTLKKIKNDPAFLKWVLHFIKYLEIVNLSTREVSVDDPKLRNILKKEKDEELVKLFTTIKKIQDDLPPKDQLLSFHRKYDENNLFTDTIPFNFDTQESEGTKKLLYFLGPLYDTLKNGRIMIMDEFDSKLHSNMTSNLLTFFHRFNKNNAQLVFTVHDLTILNREVFRRDQIWFIEKNQFGASELYSLADFKAEKVRNKSSFNKNYIEGKYGAIPYFEIDEKLNQLLYGEN